MLHDECRMAACDDAFIYVMLLLFWSDALYMEAYMDEPVTASRSESQEPLRRYSVRKTPSLSTLAVTSGSKKD